MNQETTHTPGPWTVTESSRPGNGTGWRDIVATYACGAIYVGEALEENATLIAAAPELLEALRELLLERYALENPEQFDADGNWTSDSPASVKARAAISKATSR